MRGNPSFSVLRAAVLLLGVIVLLRDVRQLLSGELLARAEQSGAKSAK